MHGLMFREFFMFAEDATSKGFVQDMIGASRKANASDYDASGPYDQDELIAMMDFLARRTDYEFDELCNDFGRRLFHRFTVLYQELFEDQTMALDFLHGIEAHIHEHVRTLVPKSQPPSFEVSRPKPDELIMHYRSARPFADLCAGLIEASLEHFGVNASVDHRPIGDTKSEAVFTITTHS
jgi:hypothetical protein